MTEHEINLVAYAKAGNGKAFEEVYNIYYNRVLTLARVTVKNDADAEDILQQAFTNAWENLAGLSNPAAFSAWLQKITVNLCYRLLQRKNIAILMDIENDLEDYSEEPSSELLPAIYAERGDLRIRLGRIIDGLSDIQKQTIVLFYFNELKVDEIAYIMDCNAGTVKKRLFLARRAIRTEIEEEERKSGEKFYGVAGIPMLALKNLLKDHFEACLPSSVSVDVTTVANDTYASGETYADVASTQMNNATINAATAAIPTATGMLASTKIAVIAAIAVVCVGLGVLGAYIIGGVITNNDRPGDDDRTHIYTPDVNPGTDEPTTTPELTPTPSSEPELDDDASLDDEPQDEPQDEPLYNIRELNSQLPRNVLAYANRTLIGLKTDGTVVYAVGNVQGERQLELLRGWSDIVSVYTGARLVSRDEFFGIRSNGTVVYTYPIDGENPILDSWTDIIDLSMDNGIIVGLKSDGTVVGYNGCLYGGDAPIREIESWTNITEVHALELSWHPVIIGLRADGTVVFTDSDLGLEYLNRVRGWTDIVSLHCGYTSGAGAGRGYIIGIKSDGTVVLAVDDDATIDSEYILGWTDIIEVSTSSVMMLSNTGTLYIIAVVGLRADGTVVSTTSNDDDVFRRTRTRDWENVISVSSVGGSSFPRIIADGESVLHYFMGSFSSASVMSDGTVRLGWSSSEMITGPEGVENWTDIRTTPVIR